VCVCVCVCVSIAVTRLVQPRRRQSQIPQGGRSEIRGDWKDQEQTTKPQAISVWFEKVTRERTADALFVTYQTRD